MQAIANNPEPAASPEAAPTPAIRRDSLRPTALITTLFSLVLLLNVLWWALTPNHTLAPVIPAWLVETALLGVLSIIGMTRPTLPTMHALVYVLQALGIANVTFSNVVPTAEMRLWAIVSAGATLVLSGVLTAWAYRTHPTVVPAEPTTRLGNFRMLMKFRIISLLLLTTLVPMYVANGGHWPSVWAVLATLLGGTLAAGGANAINMFVDRDIDAVMSRTKKRPLPGNRLKSHEVLGFGLALSVLSFLVLWPVNLLAALLAVGGIFYYVVIYTLWLKRSTTQNIVIGGGAGAIPPMVGWAAGADLSVFNTPWIEWLPPIFLFMIVFYWTPPHFWALALVRREDYARAGVPMLPVVVGEAETRRQIVLYSVLMVALTWMLVPLQVVGVMYLGAALVLGAIFLYYAVRMLSDHSTAATWRLYRYSLLYLALLFVAMGIDKALLK